MRNAYWMRKMCLQCGCQGERSSAAATAEMAISSRWMRCREPNGHTGPTGPKRNTCGPTGVLNFDVLWCMYLADFAESVESIESKPRDFALRLEAWKSLLREPEGPLQSSDLPPKPPPSPLEVKHRRLLAVGLEAGTEWTGEMMHCKSHACQPSLTTATGQGTIKIIFYSLPILLCLLIPAWRHSWSIRHQSCDMDECVKGRTANSRNSIISAFQEVSRSSNFYAFSLPHRFSTTSHNQVLLIGWTPCYIPRWGAIAWHDLITNPAWTRNRFEWFEHIGGDPMRILCTICMHIAYWITLTVWLYTWHLRLLRLDRVIWVCFAAQFGAPMGMYSTQPPWRCTHRNSAGLGRGFMVGFMAGFMVNQRFGHW